MPAFKITFKKTTQAVTDKPITEIKVNGSVVGHIYPPGHDTHAPGKHHVTVLMSVMDSPSNKTLKPVFDNDDDARKYLKDELIAIHRNSTSGLYFTPKPTKKEYL